MILIDSNVLVALVESRDSLHKQAQTDWGHLIGQTFIVTDAILTETTFVLARSDQRLRLLAMLNAMEAQPCPIPESLAMRTDIFTWMQDYAEHAPGWADAHLAVLCGYQKRFRVWSYDTEFRSIWRRLDGGRISVVGTDLR